MRGRLGAPSDGSAAHWSAGPNGTTPHAIRGKTAGDVWIFHARRAYAAVRGRSESRSRIFHRLTGCGWHSGRHRRQQDGPSGGSGSDRSLECCSVSQDPVLRQTGTPTRDLPRTSGSARRFVASQPATPRFGANRGAGPAAQPRAEPRFGTHRGPGRGPARELARAEPHGAGAGCPRGRRGPSRSRRRGFPPAR